MRIFVLAFSLCVLAAGAAVASGSWSIPPAELRLEGAQLSTDALFARVDSLEAILEDLDGEAKVQASFRLGQLYLASHLKKHRRHALELLEECLRHDPAFFEAAELRARTAHAMRYTRAARKWFEGLTAEFDRDARSHVELGRFHFLEARRRMIRDEFEAARAAFTRACEVDSTSVEAWYGRAASALALGLHDDVLTATQRLGRLDPDDVRSLFVEAAARAALDESVEAYGLFVEALAGSEEGVRGVFEDAEGFIVPRDLESLAERVVARPEAHAALVRQGEEIRPGEEIEWRKALEDPQLRARLLEVYWSSKSRRPAQLYHERQLTYWQRLVESDVLFGRPEADLRGWQTPPGELYVRFGRPTSVYYDPGSRGNLFDELEVAGVRLPPVETIPKNVPVWIWTYRSPQRWFSVLFSDPSMNARWMLGGGTAMQVADLRREDPIHVDTAAPTPDAPFHLSVSTAHFPRSDDEAVLETYIGIEPVAPTDLDPESAPIFVDDAAPDGEAAWVVEWAVFDDTGRRVDHRRERVEEDSRRSSIERVVGWPSTETLFDPAIVPIGARLPSGRYRVAVEVTGAAESGRRAVSVRVEVPPTDPASLLSMSDLELATAFTPYEADLELPARYVKHRQVVLPSPDRRIPLEAESMGVYFELSHLGVDDGGRTEFDVLYEIFRSSRSLRQRLLTPGFARATLERIEPLTASFVQERTGVSPEGLVIKGARLEVGSLGAGDYVLLVTVRDHIGGQTVSRAVPFRRGGS